VQAAATRWHNGAHSGLTFTGGQPLGSTLRVTHETIESAWANLTAAPRSYPPAGLRNLRRVPRIRCNRHHRTLLTSVCWWKPCSQHPLRWRLRLTVPGIQRHHRRGSRTAYRFVTSKIKSGEGRGGKQRTRGAELVRTVTGIGLPSKLRDADSDGSGLADRRVGLALPQLRNGSLKNETAHAKTANAQIWTADLQIRLEGETVA